MNVKLKEIATVSSGAIFRSRIIPSNLGNIKVIQMKDLDKNNTVRLDKTICIEGKNAKPNQLAKLNDLIFRSRGQTNTVALLQRDIKNTIIAAPLFRIRPNPKKIISKFLFWWINQKTSQAYFNSRSEGTMIKMVSKRSLEDLEIILPPLEKQHKIAEFFKLVMKEQQLLEKIKKHKALYTQGILMQMALER